MSDRPHTPYVFDARRSAAYDRRARSLLAGLYRVVAADVVAAAPPAGVVLDVGTGPGRLLHEVARRRADLVLNGVDVSPDMVALASAAAGPWAERISFRVADVARLPHEDDSVDVVVSTLSAHEWPDRAAAFAELARVLRPGGALLVYDFRFSRVGRGLAAAFTGVSRVPVRPARWPVALFSRLGATARRPGW